MVGKTMGLYLAANFLLYTVAIFTLFLCLIIGVDIVEFSRRTTSVADIQSGEILTVLGSDAGNIQNGNLCMDLVEGRRTKVLIEFSEPYEGPIDVVALKSTKEAANEN